MPSLSSCLPFVLLVLAVGFAAECYDPQIPVPLFYCAYIAVSLFFREPYMAHAKKRNDKKLYKHAAWATGLLIAVGSGIPSFLMREMLGYTLGIDYLLFFIATGNTGMMINLVIVKEGFSYSLPPATRPPCKGKVPRGPDSFSFCPSLSPSFQPFRPLADRNTVTLRRLLVESRIGGIFLLRTLSREEACQDTGLLAA